MNTLWQTLVMRVQLWFWELRRADAMDRANETQRVVQLHLAAVDRETAALRVITDEHSDAADRCSMLQARLRALRMGTSARRLQP